MDSKIFKGLTLTLLALGASLSHAQVVQEVATESPQDTQLVVPLYKSRVLGSSVAVERVSIGNPGIADILLLRDRELYVLGKDLGTTNVLLWDNNDRLIGSVAVEVTHDLNGLKAKLFELLPSEQIRIHAAQRSIVLSGPVSSLSNMNAALQLAQGYLSQGGMAANGAQPQAGESPGGPDGEVINLMQVSGAQQVMLEVKVAEISRTELRRLDLQFNGINNTSSRWTVGGVNGGASFPDGIFQPGNVRIPVFAGEAPFGPVIDEFMPNPMTIQNTGLFASLLTGHGLLNLALDAARENGVAKILAEPTLTTLSGQEAQFLSGGEFPMPVPQGLNGVTIEFKEFGVGLRFLPLVLSSGHINLKLNISVSEIIEANSVAVTANETTSTFLVPALSKRSASATVELADGQTIGIAGLINEDLREVINKFPGLGSIPLLGNLFRSQEFIKGETELVILVTPRLARPLPRGDIRLPTDDFIEPSVKDFYLMGRLEGKPREDRAGGAADVSSSDGGVESAFGHAIN